MKTCISLQPVWQKR